MPGRVCLISGWRYLQAYTEQGPHTPDTWQATRNLTMLEAATVIVSLMFAGTTAQLSLFVFPARVCVSMVSAIITHRVCWHLALQFQPQSPEATTAVTPDLIIPVTASARDWDQDPEGTPKDMMMTPGGGEGTALCLAIQSRPATESLIVPLPSQSRTLTATTLAFLATPTVLPTAVLAT